MTVRELLEQLTPQQLNIVLDIILEILPEGEEE